MSEDVQFTCEVCGKSFDPDPDAMIEWEMEPQRMPSDRADEGVPRVELEAMNEWDLKAIGLTPEQRDALLRGESVTGGGCICIECQDELAAEMPPEAGRDGPDGPDGR